MRMLSIVVATLVIATLAMSTHNPSGAEQPELSDRDQARLAIQRLEIVPVIVMKPGETKEVFFSTQCTVGYTRGGGLNLAEMKNGLVVPSAERLTKTYTTKGVTVTVPHPKVSTKTAEEPRFASAAEQSISVFSVTVSAADDAEPGLINMHLKDSTCSGECQSDFRIIITE